MLVIRVGIHKSLVKKANSEVPDQTASSDLGLQCLSRPFWQNWLICLICPQKYFLFCLFDLILCVPVNNI